MIVAVLGGLLGVLLTKRAQAQSAAPTPRKSTGPNVLNPSTIPQAAPAAVAPTAPASSAANAPQVFSQIDGAIVPPGGQFMGPDGIPGYTLVSSDWNNGQAQLVVQQPNGQQVTAFAPVSANGYANVPDSAAM